MEEESKKPYKNERERQARSDGLPVLLISVVSKNSYFEELISGKKFRGSLRRERLIRKINDSGNTGFYFFIKREKSI